MLTTIFEVNFLDFNNLLLSCIITLNVWDRRRLEEKRDHIFSSDLNANGDDAPSPTHYRLAPEQRGHGGQRVLPTY